MGKDRTNPEAIPSTSAGPAQAGQCQRRHPRFRPGPLDVAKISFAHVSSVFTIEVIALPVSGGYGGCAILVASNPQFAPGARCRILLSGPDPMSAEVVWVQNLDSETMKVGFRFLEEA